jgi:hypothetical protein
LWRVLPDVDCVEAQGIVGGPAKVNGLGVVGGLGMIGGLCVVGGLGVRVPEQHPSHHWQAHFNCTAHGLASLKGVASKCKMGHQPLCQQICSRETAGLRQSGAVVSLSVSPLKILIILASFCQNAAGDNL